ncbi:MAG: 50S ribosomal protein L4 [candidate division TM6 bacterium GW2011_GWF2_37_49]|nr:MAG: 50S ribosomal protein L4 [candidate division TM6 bacterium GW2011_GWF2_37_49]
MAEIAIYGTDGKIKSSLSVDLNQKEISPKTFSCAIRALRQNWRQGTVGCKTRAELSFSNRKPWKQKGTGRARAGSLRSPLWRKGGIIFGPQPRTRNLTINDKQKCLVFNNILFSKLNNESISCLDFDILDKSSTKSAKQILNVIGLTDKKVLLFLQFNDTTLIASFRNIPGVHIISFDQPNAYDMVNMNNLVFLKKDVELFKEMISRWN